jgi:hypothetical protein
MGKCRPTYSHGGIEPEHEQPCIFKCYDFTTEIVGRYDHNEKNFYVQRGDGARYWYRFGIEWHIKLKGDKYE